MAFGRGARRGAASPGMEPLPPRRKWRAILLSTLLFIPGYWFLLNGLVSAAATGPGGPDAGPLIAFGLALVPFVFVVLAFLSEHPRAPGAVLRAMGVAVLVGVPVEAVARDAVTGLVAGVGAGGITALRAELTHDWKARALAVLAVSAFVYLLLRTATAPALLLAPALPFTAIGVADHLVERQAGGGP